MKMKLSGTIIILIFTLLNFLNARTTFKSQARSLLQRELQIKNDLGKLTSK